MTWFTSDWHLRHANIIKYCHRPFKDVEEMNQTILRNFWEKVMPYDEVYFLGDFCFKDSGDKLVNFMQEIKDKHIKFHLILGSHDKRWEGGSTLNKHCASVSNMKNIEVEEQAITLCHYPMMTWHKSHYGSWQLFGHHHSSIITMRILNNLPGKKMNVCADLHKFYPVSFKEVKEWMEAMPENWDLIKNKNEN